MTEWISLDEAATILQRHRTTIYRSLVNPQWRQEWWGAEGTGWRKKPLTRRTIYQVSKEHAERLLAEEGGP